MIGDFHTNDGQPARRLYARAERKLPVGWSFWLAATISLVAGRRTEAVERKWELSPYRVVLTLAVDDAAYPSPGFEQRLVASLEARVDAAAGSLWQLTIRRGSGAADLRRCFSAEEEQEPPEDMGADKCYWLGVRSTPNGSEILCREFDSYVRRWSTPRTAFTAQRRFVEEECFQTLWKAFAPLARIVLLPDDPAQVELVFRGRDLPRRGAEPLVAEGQPLLPLVRRTDRLGKMLDESAAVIPWTYLTAVAVGESAARADVVSGLRIPLGVPRRGFLEQLALPLPAERSAVKLRLCARSDPRQGLAGHEVFRRRGAGLPAEPLGVTDRNGLIAIPPGETLVSMLYVRSEGRLLAKVPVAAGAATVLEAPLADDPARTEASAETQAIREELIDVVARRAIASARVKRAIREGDLEAARQLMEGLSALPTTSVFASRINSAERRTPKSDDPAVQKAIVAQFAAVREILGRFLDSRSITQLQFEVNEAATNGATPSDAAPDSSPEPKDDSAADS